MAFSEPFELTVFDVFAGLSVAVAILLVAMIGFAGLGQMFLLFVVRIVAILAEAQVRVGFSLMSWLRHGLLSSSSR